MILYESTLYQAIETALSGCKAPVTCVELYGVPNIRRLAESSNRVSDYLGNMWRRGQVLRYPAPKDSGTASRWAYALAPKVKRRKNQSAPVPTPDTVIELPTMTITIRYK